MGKTSVKFDPILPLVDLDRFYSKFVSGGEDDCWDWMACLNQGYGSVWSTKAGSQLYAHRVAYALHNGEPGTLVIDHTCRNRSCVNPRHLRAVTPRDNTLADGSLSLPALNRFKRCCPQGHEYNDKNTRYPLTPYGRKYRRCRICERESGRRYEVRIRAGQ